MTAAVDEHFRVRVVQEAVAAGLAATWERRAEAFEAARPRVDDYTGQATVSDLAAQDRRLAAVAQACRNRATLALGKVGAG